MEGATLSTERIHATGACVVPLSNEQGPQAVRAVFTVLREAVSEGELKDVLHQLGGDYTTLVGSPTGTP